MSKINSIDQKQVIELFRFKNELEKKGDKISTKGLQEKFSISDREAAQLIFIIANSKVLENYFAVTQDLQNKKIATNLNHEKAKNKQLTNQVENLELQNEFLLSIQEEAYEIPKFKESEKIESEAVAISILSDIHIEERVDSDTVYGLNEYNPDIADKRVKAYFTNLMKMVRKERQDVQIDKLIIGLLGDNITGYIHEELKESNYLSPTEATLMVKGMLMSGLKMLSEDGGFNEIIVPCCKGNHGRTTDKKRHATAYKNSYEWMLYQDMAQTFKMMGGYENLKFEIPKSELTYVQAFDKKLRFGHGDHFRFIGGVGGLAIPLMKFLYRINEVTHADMSFFGHYHQMLKPSSNCLMNGSLIGYNAYAAGIGAKPETPMQQFQLLDKKRGFTVNTPILCS